MPEGVRRLQIPVVVAFIGFFGVLGSAFISNWHNIFNKGASAKTNALSLSLAGAASATQTDTSLVHTVESNDTFQPVGVSPPPGSVLDADTPFAITMRIRYNLVSAESVILASYLETFIGDGCATGHLGTIVSGTPDQVPIKRGHGEVFVKFAVTPEKMWPGQHVRVAPNASTWAGFDGQGRVILIKENLWSFEDYCYKVESKKNFR